MSGKSWRLEDGANSPVFDGRVVSGDLTIAFVQLGTDSATLIAAAPELLEALKALTAACEKLPRISKAMPEAGSPLGLARAALAKAGVA